MSKGSLFTEISVVILGIFLIYTIFFVFNHQDEVMHEIMYFSTKEERNLDVQLTVKDAIGDLPALYPLSEQIKE